MKRWLHRYAARRGQRIAARLAPHLPVAGRVLDIGSGTGHNAAALRLTTRLEYVETDVVDFHVVGPGPVVCGDARLPFGEGEFDAAMLCHVLHYTADAAAALGEAARVAGLVVVVQSTGGGRLARAALALRGFFLARIAFLIARAAGFIPPAPFAMRSRGALSRDDVREAAARAGLAVLHFVPDAYPAPFGGRDLFVLGRRS